VTGIVETALHVEDLRCSADFYRRLLGCEILQEDGRFCALQVAASQVLLLFRRGGTTEPVVLPGGVIPPHDGAGRLHVGFGIPADRFEAWERRLTELNIPVESRVHWPRGGRSLFFRDPDGHLVELLTPGTWKNY
jgi:catechol 2,3-dioxygenase-like lactoylglutathione lyase family enzyme